MTMFANLNNEGLAPVTDRLGGGGGAVETNIYNAVVKYAFGITAASGAKGVTLALTLEGDHELRETAYVTNKEGQNFYVKDGTKNALPGFIIADDMCLCAAGKSIADMAIEEKVINLWDNDLKKEVPKAVPMLVELIGQPVTVAVFRQVEDKTKKDDASGKYLPTGETRTINTIDKVFNTETRMTVAEARAGETEPKFYDAWLARNQGKDRDRTSKDAGTNGMPKAANNNAPPMSPAGGKPKSLFAK